MVEIPFTFSSSIGKYKGDVENAVSWLMGKGFSKSTAEKLLQPHIKRYWVEIEKQASRTKKKAKEVFKLPSISDLMQMDLKTAEQQLLKGVQEKVISYEQYKTQINAIMEYKDLQRRAEKALDDATNRIATITDELNASALDWELDWAELKQQIANLKNQILTIQTTSEGTTQTAQGIIDSLKNTIATIEGVTKTIESIKSNKVMTIVIIAIIGGIALFAVGKGGMK